MFKNVFFSIIIILLFGWGMVSLYDSQIQFAEIMKDPEPPWEITMNILPIVAMIIIGGGLSFMIYRRERNKGKSWLKAMFFPHDFEEDDEREEAITAKATRAAYVSMWISFPIVSALLLLYPHISNTVPYYPIIVFLLLPTIQIITYTVSWRKHYKQ